MYRHPQTTSERRDDLRGTTAVLYRQRLCPGPAPELSHPSVPYPTGLAGEKKPSHGTHCPIDSATLHSPLSIRVHDGELE